MEDHSKPRYLFPMSEKAKGRYTRELGVLVELLDRKQTHSQMVFGPGPRLAGVLDHIRRELVEVEKEPWNVFEWVDVIALAMDGAMRNGASAGQVVAALINKQQIVENRKYPDWRDHPDSAIEHIREDE